MLTGKPSLINQMGYSQMFSSLGGHSHGLLGISQQDYLNQLAMQQQAAQQSPYWASQAQAASLLQNAAPATNNTDERLLVLLTEE